MFILCIVIVGSVLVSLGIGRALAPPRPKRGTAPLRAVRADDDDGTDDEEVASA